jgi:hypothetical protein
MNGFSFDSETETRPVIMPASCRDFLERRRATKDLRDALRPYAEGSTVWARYGTLKWRAAIVDRIGRKVLHLRFVAPGTGKPLGKGKRDPRDVRPRDTKAHGKDKPAPGGEK